MIAFAEPGYGEMVIHPPPINILCLILVVFSTLIPDAAIMSNFCLVFSKVNFWIENLVMVIAFFLFELLLSPLIYFKTLYNVIYSSNGLFTTVFSIFRWIIMGPLYLLWILFNDVKNLLNILRMHDGCKEY